MRTCGQIGGRIGTTRKRSFSTIIIVILPPTGYVFHHSRPLAVPLPTPSIHPPPCVFRRRDFPHFFPFDVFSCVVGDNGANHTMYANEGKFFLWVSER